MTHSCDNGADHKPPAEEEKWESHFRKVWYETFDHDGEIDEHRYTEMIEYIRSLLRTALESAYRHGAEDAKEAMIPMSYADEWMSKDRPITTGHMEMWNAARHAMLSAWDSFAEKKGWK